MLRRAGILERFDGWAFSDEVGAYKPDPVIFHHALREIGGVEPGRAAHIGDLRRTDIAGARAMGMVGRPLPRRERRPDPRTGRRATTCSTTTQRSATCSATPASCDARRRAPAPAG